MRRLATSIFAIGLASAASADAPNVVAGTAPAHGLTSRIMDGVGTPTRIVPAGADAHHHSMRPSDARALRAADMVVWIGPELTPWLAGPVEELAADARHVELMRAAGLDLMSYEDDHDAHGHDDHDHDEHGHDDHGHKDDDHKAEDHAHDDHGHDDHGHDDHAHDDHDHEAHDDHDHEAHDDHDHEAHDDHDHDDHEHAAAGHHDHAHEGDDPHAWLDPGNAKIWMNMIAEALAEQDPAHAERYRANAAAAAAEVDAAAAEAKARLAALGPVHLVVAHDAWGYFERAYDVEIIGALADGHASPAGAARIAGLRDAVATHDTVCVLAEPSTPVGLIEAVGASGMAVANPEGFNVASDAGYYPALMDHLVTAIEECLS